MTQKFSPGADAARSALRHKAHRALGPKIGDLFLSLCEALPSTEKEHLAHEVRAYLGRLELGLRHNHGLDLYLAQRLVSASLRILARYDELSEEARGLAVGAVRYFLRPNDASHDVNAAEGLDDDAQVMNFAAELCGIRLPDLRNDEDEEA
jgi:hypothetical protein